MASFYANENFPLPTVEELRRLGHDVLTVLETGKAGKRTPDQEVLDFAISAQRVVLTHNRKHFIRLHRERASHAGIVICTFDPDFVRQAGRIHDSVTGIENLAGQLFRVTRPPR